MRKSIDVLALIAILLIVGIFLFSYRDRVEGFVHQLYARFEPCRQPITYRIDSVDPKFGITRATVQKALSDAETIWEHSSGKNLFSYSASGTIGVSLVYDARQKATDTLKSIGIAVDTRMSSYQELKARYDALNSSVTSEKAALEVEERDFETRQSTYNTEVQSWNARGGAPPSEYRRLQSEKEALSQEADAIHAQEAKVNADIDGLNALGRSLNKLIAALNLNVETYNNAGRAAPSEFEEGLYQSEAGKETITIFEYSSYTELVRVLAHELGHALGLEHVDDKNAIMYPINEGEALSATAADIKALNTLCASSIF